MLMDSIFVADEVERSNILHFLFQSFGCTYVCIWSYLPNPTNKCLIFKDGLFMEAMNHHHRATQRSSSTESLTTRLFTEYTQSTINVDNDVDGFVPGFAFKNKNPFLELNEFDLQGFASLEAQRHFYMEANIKRVIFMGCNGGEIELGFGSNLSQVNLEIELRKWFPDDFSRQVQLKENDQNSIMAAPFQDPQGSSSSSSLKSLSIGSPETSAFYNFTQAFRPTTTMPSSLESRSLGSTGIPSFQSAMQTFTLLPNSHFPLADVETDVITSAILAVLSASATSNLPQFNTPFLDPLAPLEGTSTGTTSNRFSAFRRYLSSNLPSSSNTGQIPQNPNRVSAFKRIISFTSKSLQLKRLQELHALSGGGGKRPSSSQLHHMISERKRRVKMNESFDALRSLLPIGTKKHKALILNGAIDYLTSLQSQVAELSLRNLRLEAQLLPITQTQQDKSASSSDETRSDYIQINTVSSESTSNDDHLVDVRVRIQGEISLLSIVSRFVEFLREINSLSLMSMEAETLLATDPSAPSNHIFFRLRIQGLTTSSTDVDLWEVSGTSLPSEKLLEELFLTSYQVSPKLPIFDMP